MRRWLLIFLLFLLPLQFSWAASASYCQHERDTRTQHWGHHEHSADHAADHAADEGQDNGKQPSASFGDCAVCHFGHAQHAVAALAEPVGTAVMAHRPRAMPSESFVSHISEVPVRPAWTLFA